jgi:peptidyl-Lys metalloendopeptidase
VSSNTASHWFQGVAEAPQTQRQAVVSGANSFLNCTASQQTDLLSARNQASTYSGNANSYLQSNPSLQGPRYVSWFGVYDATRYSTVANHFTAIGSAMDTAPVTFDCGCKKKKIYAYVQSGNPYQITLCGAFWGAPMAGTDSKAGTLIHEMSHFTVVADTDDVVYGQSGARNLAISDPARAITNADSHEYFAENTPFEN